MAYDGTAYSARYNHRLKVTVGGNTYRWGDRTLSMDDDTLWERRIVSAPPLTLSAGAVLSVRPVLPDFSVTLSNTDDVVRDLLDNNNGLADATFVYSIGQGTTEADYSVRFTGRLKFPGGARYDDRIAELAFVNAINADARPLPTSKVFPSTYANAEDKSKYKVIPIVIGDWRTTAGGGEKLPAYCIDTTEGLGGRFKWSEGPVVGLEDVYVDDVSASYTADDANGEFVLDQAYDPATETVTVNGRGVTQDGTASGTLAETLPDIADYILQQQLGVSSGNIDSTSLTTWTQQLSATDVGRRWIGSEKSSNVLLAELANEGFCDWILDDDGKYAFPFRIASNPSSTTIFRKPDILPRANGGLRVRVSRDPDEAYCNEVVADSRNVPTIDVAGAVTTDYELSDEVSDATAISNVGQRHRRRLKLNYLYQDGAATDRANRELLAFKNEPEFLDPVTLGPRALTLKPTDQFQLVYSKYEVLATLGTPFMVRRITPDFDSMEAVILAWNLDDLSPKRYQADGSSDENSATAYDLAVMGFYDRSDSVYF